MKKVPSQIVSTKANLADLGEVCASIGSYLGREGSFCLWLSGDLGSGKTTLTRQLLRNLGLSEDVHVSSPTFTYMNEYLISGDWYGHLDFYRANSHETHEDLGVALHRDYRGLFVEWPRAIATTEAFFPTHELCITTITNDSRLYVLSAY